MGIFWPAPGPSNAEFASLQDGLAIVADGNTHIAITSGQYVYVKNHETLSDGLYKASSNIAANATLSSSNLTADSKGGLNNIADQIGSLSSLNTSEKGSVVGAVNELVGNRVKKRTFSMTASEVKSITDLPSRYMLFANAWSTAQLGIWVGTGYGATAQRHILKEITGNSALNISVTVGSSVYGLNITNSDVGSTNFTLVDIG